MTTPRSSPRSSLPSRSSSTGTSASRRSGSRTTTSRTAWAATYDKEPWTPDQPRLTGVAQTAFEVNLLTEDNLPSYHRLIHKMFSKGDGAWKNWINRWTAEEGRHAIVIRDYLVVTRNIDPVALERGRMQNVLTGYDHDVDVLQGLAYTSFQELATRVSHQNTGRYSDDPVADKIMTRVASDENLHMVFYRDALAAMLEVAPSEVVKAITREVLTFEMPGSGIAGFTRKAAQDGGRRASTTCASITTTSSGRCCATGRSSTSPVSTPRPSTTASVSVASSRSSMHRRANTRSGAPRVAIARAAPPNSPTALASRVRDTFHRRRAELSAAVRDPGIPAGSSRA